MGHDPEGHEQVVVEMVEHPYATDLGSHPLNHEATCRITEAIY